MKHVLLLTLLLSGCSNIVYRDAPFNDHNPAWRDALERNGFGFALNMPPPVLTRPDDTEQPRTVRVEYEPQVFLPVQVYDRRCGPNGGGYFDQFNRIAYLCGKPALFRHEVMGHGAGMTHSSWEGGCTTITNTGYKTGYQLGSRVCVADDGREWVQK